jgi:hypothetical protein
VFESFAHSLDCFGQGRSSPRKADGLDAREPFGLQVLSPLDVKHRFTRDAARLDKLPRVVARSSADDYNRIRNADQFPQRRLPIFRRLANSIDESHVRLGVRATNKIDNLPDERDRLGRLRNNPVTRTLREPRNILRRTQHYRFRKISYQSFDFHMTSLANDDRKVAGLHKSFQLLMRVPYEWTSSIENRGACFVPRLAFRIRHAVRGDHDSHGSRSYFIDRRFADALRSQAFAYNRVVNELTENRELSLAHELLRLRDGVAHAEADPEVLS